MSLGLRPRGRGAPDPAVVASCFLSPDLRGAGHLRPPRHACSSFYMVPLHTGLAKGQNGLAYTSEVCQSSW